MRIGVLSESDRPDWPLRSLQKAASLLRIDLQVLRSNQLSSHVSSKEAEIVSQSIELGQFDAYIIRGIGWPTNLDKIQHRTNMLRILESLGKPVMNPVEGLLRARDKEYSLALLASQGMRVPETVICESLSEAVRTSRRFKQVVIKPLQGSRGYGVIRADGVDSAFHALRIVAQTSGVFYVQRFIPDVAENLRIFTIGEEAIGCMRLKASATSWKSNIAQGGRAIAKKEFAEEAKVALRAATSLGLWYAGVDILVTADRQMVINEINASPNWRTFEGVTRTNPARGILEYLVARTR